MDLDSLFRRSVESWAAQVAGIAADQWGLPTPCSGWTVRDLVNHVVGEDLWAPPLIAGSTIGDVGDRFDGDVLGEDPIEVAQAAAVAAIAATSDALPAGGTVQLSFGETPLEEYIWQLVADHLVHRWDLAAALGAPRQLDGDTVAEVAGWFAEREEMYRGAGVVGPRVPVAVGDPQADLLAGFGRDPEWNAG